MGEFLRRLIDAFRSGYELPMNHFSPPITDEEISRRIVACIGQDDIFLSRGRYVTQKDMDARRKEISSYRFVKE
ncbi:MAG: hypothetical protein Q8L27_01245 [archaeon]|nr:hypothetical protein [archaeon]